MSYLRLLLIVSMVVMAVPIQSGAQARTWAFSKDTVYGLGMGDNVTLSNSNPDTLRIDSLILELVRPSATYYEVFFSTPFAPCLVRYDQGRVTFPSNQKPKFNAGQSVLSSFDVEMHIPVVAKRADLHQGDTMVVRMIFLAGAGRGRDTLMLIGQQNSTVALRLPEWKMKELKSSERLFDLRGRHIGQIPEGAKVPRTPLVSPKE